VEEKEYTDENNIIAWHFDHSKGRSLKGINILSGRSKNWEKETPIINQQKRIFPDNV